MRSTSSHDLYGRNYYQEKTSVRGGSYSTQVLQEDGQREGYQRSVSLPPCHSSTHIGQFSGKDIFVMMLHVE